MYAPAVTHEVASLCHACGLCCDGTLFTVVSLAPDEVEPARRSGLTVLDDHDAPHFDQPCPQHHGDACAIYPERPRRCQTFRCALLDRHAAGELGEEECLARIARMKALSRSLRSVLQTVPVRRSLRTRVRERLRASDPAVAGELLMDLQAFELLVTRDFQRSS